MEGINKWYGSYHALRNVNLNVRRGERIVICGPSGSGKSTLIRMHQPARGHPGGQASSSTASSSPPAAKNVDEVRQDVGMVFQQFNLFPHLTILENCMLAPLKVRKTPRAEAEATRASISTASAFPSRPTNIRPSSRAASSSAWRSPARSA